jgi:pimeloyl-ACP methyl ester carboxylesterase
VSFEPAGAWVDVLHVRRAASAQLEGLSETGLRELAAIFRGGFLDGVELPDFQEFQAWRAAEREHFRAIHLRVLRALLARLDARPDDAVPVARDIVTLTPEDEAARATLVRLLNAMGRREEAEEHYSLGRRQIAKRGVDRGDLRDAWRAPAPVARSSAEPEEQEAARQVIRFCKAPDGVRIAYATLGEGPVLVKTANWMSHLEYDHKSPLWRHLARDLSRDFTLVRYDQRGNGLSDWDVQDFSLDAFVADLEAVVDASGQQTFSLLGVSQGCRVAIAYAAKHPERVSRLVLYGGAARGWRHRNPSARDTRAGLQALIKEGWGRDVPAFRQVFTTLFMPGATPEQAAWFNDLQRVSSSAENAYRMTEALADADVREQLANVRAPTLVMHATQDAMVPFEEARVVAAGIPGARFVALESHNHLLLEDEPAFARFISEIRDFLRPIAGAR